MNLFDCVQLKDGRTGVIVEVYDGVCDVDVGASPKDWDTITVTFNDIERVLPSRTLTVS